MKQTYWLWYPGDFEIYHGMIQNFAREERGFDWPAFWHIDDCRKNVKFLRSYELEEETAFTVYSHGSGFLTINEEKHRFGEKVVCGPGKVDVVIFAGIITGVPSVFVEGEVICSDQGWKVTDFISEPVNAGYNSRYCKKEQNPTEWEYASVLVQPGKIMEQDGGVLYDFGRELTAELELKFAGAEKEVLVCYGESVPEAMDQEWCYYSQKVTTSQVLRKRAFRYVYIPNTMQGEITLTARHIYVDIPVRASFQCEDEELNQIWNISRETFQLCSGIFFIDGVKRDRWIWSGDAYQSYLVNPYLFFDEDINKRTIWALRGNGPVRRHINTIMDYSMYWVISIYDHYKMSGDLEFMQMIYPKVKTMMEFLEAQLDENGFIVGKPDDWIFIDWADLDKNGPLCAEQMLLLRCYETMQTLETLLVEADSDNENTVGNYQKKYADLKEKIDQYFWCEKKGAYIDSFTSGREHVSRHSNLFAILFEQADAHKKELICENVIYNDSVPQITTPYFKFYELDLLCRMGRNREVLDQIKSYWGGMLKEGAATVWEEYNPQQHGLEQYAMYGDPYGKSLCHAWGATPIYLIGRYFMGVEATKPGYETFKVAPDTSVFENFQCTVPVKNGQVQIAWDGTKLSVLADRAGGTLEYAGNVYELKAGEEVVLSR